MPGRPRSFPRPEPLTTVEQALAPITRLGQFVTPQLALEILATPAPRWPPRFSCAWEPTAGGPVYNVTAETRSRPLLGLGNLLDDPRSVTLRIEGSPSRRVNDWAGFSCRFSGTALHRTAAVLAERPAARIIAFVGTGAGVVLRLSSIEVFHDVVSTCHGYVDWAASSPIYFPVQDGPNPPTKGDLKLIERGGRLLTRFVTTMTLRGHPSQDRAATRARLLEAATKLRQRAKTIGLTGLADALGTPSEHTVSTMLKRADWILQDLVRELNKRQAGQSGRL